MAFARSGARTVIRRALAHSPSRVLMPGNHGHAAWAYVTHFGGGLLAGDEVALHLEVDAGASALVSSQGHTRVFQSERGCASTVTATLEEGAFLALLPDPLCLFRRARLTQRTELRLAPTASLVAAEILGAGRVAQGERWQLAGLHSTLVVSRGGQALAHEQLRLDQAEGCVSSRLGRFEAFATVMLAGPVVSAQLPALARRIEAERPGPGAPWIASFSELSDDAALIRFAAPSVFEASRRLVALLDFLPGVLGDDPFARRH